MWESVASAWPRATRGPGAPRRRGFRGRSAGGGSSAAFITEEPPARESKNGRGPVERSSRPTGVGERGQMPHVVSLTTGEAAPNIDRRESQRRPENTAGLRAARRHGGAQSGRRRAV